MLACILAKQALKNGTKRGEGGLCLNVANVYALSSAFNNNYIATRSTIIRTLLFEKKLCY